MLLEARSVSKTFSGRHGAAPVDAVQEATVSVQPGQFVAIVGESGSGKSTLARMLLGLVPPTSGSVTLDDVDATQMKGPQVVRFRRNVQAVLQDPSGSLNPRKRVGRALADVVRLYRLARGISAVRHEVTDALELAGLRPAEEFLDRFPQELSGGQRQRVLIARAIVLRPSIIVADEAVSSLDASVKAEVLGVMRDLGQRLGVGYVFITHDLPIVRKVAEYVYVMKSGRIVEEGPKDRIFRAPADPYTQTLLSANPVLDLFLPESATEPSSATSGPSSRPGPLTSPSLQTRHPLQRGSEKQ